MNIHVIRSYFPYFECNQRLLDMSTTSNFNRRAWLQLAGLGGAATVIDPLSSLKLAEKAWHEKSNKYEYAKLNANENPYGPSPKVRQAIIDAFDYGCRYPGAKISELSSMIAKKEGVTPDHIVVTGGSWEGLKAAGMTYGMDGSEIISADPVYKSLLTYAEQCGAYINRVPIDKDMQHDLDEMERRIGNNTSMVFICNPNNPSGTLLPKENWFLFAKQ